MNADVHTEGSVFEDKCNQTADVLQHSSHKRWLACHLFAQSSHGSLDQIWDSQVKLGSLLYAVTYRFF
jgi:hypothetical protein